MSVEKTEFKVDEFDGKKLQAVAIVYFQESPFIPGFPLSKSFEASSELKIYGNSQIGIQYEHTTKKFRGAVPAPYCANIIYSLGDRKRK